MSRGTRFYVGDRVRIYACRSIGVYEVTEIVAYLARSGVEFTLYDLRPCTGTPGGPQMRFATELEAA